MSDLPVFLALMALALVYASALLVIRLSSLGMTRRRVIAIIVELWLTFATIILGFALVNHLVGAIPRDSIAGELAAQLARARSLPVGQQLLIYGILALAVILFAHLLWSLRKAMRTAPEGR